MWWTAGDDCIYPHHEYYFRKVPRSEGLQYLATWLPLTGVQRQWNPHRDRPGRNRSRGEVDWTASPNVVLIIAYVCTDSRHETLLFPTLNLKNSLATRKTRLPMRESWVVGYIGYLCLYLVINCNTRLPDCDLSEPAVICNLCSRDRLLHNAQAASGGFYSKSWGIIAPTLSARMSLIIYDMERGEYVLWPLSISLPDEMGMKASYPPLIMLTLL